MKTVDAIGRPATAKPSSLGETARAENKAAAEALASTVPGLREEPKAADPATAAEPAKENAEQLTEAKLRREYLEIQRLKRLVSDKEKKAASSLKQAEAFEKAKAAAESGEDPTAILKAAGLDPVRFYQRLTDYALSGKGVKEETDPVKRELAEHKTRLAQYEKDLKEQATKFAEKEDMAAKNEVIRTAVIPLLQQNTEKYETILLHYGANAAIEVFKNVWDIFEKTGTTRTFAEVADEMEAYWSEQVAKNLETVSKTKKFGGRFGAPVAQDQGSNAQAKPPPAAQPSVTLGNHPPPAVAPSANPYRGMTREERVAAILRKHT
jgi:hypothetical protein